MTYKVHFSKLCLSNEETKQGAKNMPIHPETALNEIHAADLSAQNIEGQAEIIKGLLLRDGVADVGRAVTDNYTLEAVIEDYQDDCFYKALAAFTQAFNREDNPWERMAAVRKLDLKLNSMIEDAASFQAKHLLGVAK